MDNIVKKIADMANVSDEIAKEIVDAVVAFLKDKLPDSIAGHLDTVLEGGEVKGGLGNLTKGLGGLLGKKK